MKSRLVLCWLLIFSLTSCSNDDPNKNSFEAEEFLNEVLDVMEANSINRYKIDWTDFRAKVFEQLIGAETLADTYPGIREALALLGDNHSSYIKPGGGFIFAGNLQCDNQGFDQPSLPENVGYVQVKAFSGSSSSTAAISFAQEIQDQIRNEVLAKKGYF